MCRAAALLVLAFLCPGVSSEEEKLNDRVREEISKLFADWFTQDESMVSVETIAAALVEALGGGEAEARSFWALGPDRDHAQIPAGVCVFGSGSSELDGWYSRTEYNISGAPAFRRSAAPGVDYHVSLFRLSNLGLSHWFLSNLMDLSANNDDVDYLRTIEPTNATLPPQPRSKWGMVESVAARALVKKVPFVLAADRGIACKRVQGAELGHVLDALGEHPPQRYNTESEEHKEALLVAASVTMVTGLVTLAFVACRRWVRGMLLRRNWVADMEEEERAHQLRILNEEQDDGLGAPPQPRLGALVAELEEVGEEDGQAEDGEDAYLEALERREVAGEAKPLWSIGLRCATAEAAARVLGPWRRWATASIATSVEHYLANSVDITKPVLVLVCVLLMLIVSRDDFEDVVRASAGVEGSTAVAIAAVALLAAFDLMRRMAIALFKLARFLGLGELRDQEAALLRKLVMEELAAGMALCFVAACETSAFSWGRGPRPARRRRRVASNGNTELLVSVTAGVTTLGATGIGVLSRLARTRLAHLVSTPSSAEDFWSRAFQHARLFGLLGSIQLVVVMVSMSLLRSAYKNQGLLAALQLVALSARASKRTTQALAHQLALAYFELPNALRRVASRCRALIFGAAAERRRPRRHRVRYNAAFGLATYYIEHVTDVCELSLILFWYAIELVSGTSSSLTTGSVLFSVLAQQAHSRLRARMAFHNRWLKARAALQTNSLFKLATQSDVDQYDDVCVVCMDDLVLPSHEKSKLPVKLPCGESLHTCVVAP